MAHANCPQGEINAQKAQDDDQQGHGYDDGGDDEWQHHETEDGAAARQSVTRHGDGGGKADGGGEDGDDAPHDKAVLEGKDHAGIGQHVAVVARGEALQGEGGERAVVQREDRHEKHRAIKKNHEENGEDEKRAGTFHGQRLRSRILE